MTETTATVPCSQRHIGPTPAAKWTVRMTSGINRTPEVRLLCGIHANAIRKSYSYSIERGDTTVEPVTPEEVAARRAVLDEEAAEARKVHAAKLVEQARRWQKRVRETWSALRTETYTTTIDPEESYSSSEVEAVVHVAGTDPRSIWRGSRVGLRIEHADLPATVRLSGGSPSELAADEARELAAVLLYFADLVDEANAGKGAA